MTLVERLKRKFISHNDVPIKSIRISREEFDEIEQRIEALEQALTQLKGFVEWIEILGRTDCEIYKHELKGHAYQNIEIIEKVLNTQGT